MAGANTDHDEAEIRAAWHGESWLGLESMQAPKHGAPIDWLAVGGSLNAAMKEES